MNYIRGKRPYSTTTPFKEAAHERIKSGSAIFRVPERKLKKNTVRNYLFFLPRFAEQFGDRELDTLTTDEVWSFLIKQTDGTSQGTKKLRNSFLSSFFNFGKNMIDPELKNPCDTPVLRKLFGNPKPRQWVVSAGRLIVKKAGSLVGVKVTPHDLRRHAATYASRAGTPIEIVSKLILRHANLSTTQRYLGTISDVEAMRWIDNLHG